MRRFLNALLFLAIAPAAFAGVSYRFESTTTGSASQTISGDVKADQGKVRIDVTAGDGILFDAGSMVLGGGGSNAIVVANPSQKTFFEIDPSNLLGSTGSALSQLQGMVNIDARNPRVSVRDGGAGGAIDGYATRRSLVDSSYELVMDMFGQKMTSTVATKSELWWTPDIPAEYANIFQVSALRTGIAALDKILAAQSGTIKGFPLKQVTTTVISMNGSEQQNTTTTTRVTNVKTLAVPAATFVLPAGFTKVDSPVEAMMKKLGR